MSKGWTDENILNLFVPQARQMSAPANAPDLSKTLSELFAAPDLSVATDAAKLMHNYLQPAPDTAAVVEQVSPLRQAFRRSSAVLSAFDPCQLKPMGLTSEPGQGAKELMDDLVEVYDPPSPKQRWMLRPEIRIEVLRELGTRQQLVAALNSNPRSERPGSLLQRTLEFHINGEKELDFESLPQDQLAAHLQAIRWLEPSALKLPSPEKLQEIIDQLEVPAVFEKMAGKNFVGRENELALLRDFVEVLPASSTLRSLRRQIRQWLGLKTKPPLVIYAAGGVGKTTLISKFLLDHKRVPRELKFPYVYLDFDNPRLSLSHPNTILSEAIRQLSVQYPEARKELKQFLDHEQIISVRQSTDGSDKILDPTLAASEMGAADSLSRFAHLVGQIVHRSADEGSYSVPLLIVLDTYEEVQYRGFKDEIQLWNLMDAIQRSFPTLRLVVFGRASLEQIPTSFVSTTTYALGELDAAAAKIFLEKLGVTDKEVVRGLYEEVGGNPLSLKLAAEIYRREGLRKGLVSKGWRDSFSFFRASELVVQGQLYQRILNHIHDADVRKMAHPGLVVRRITPELIKDVLQGPCEIVVPNDQRARELFEALGREVALVTMVSHDELAHRPDLRRIMLDFIRRDKPEQTDEINRLAAKYYAKKKGPQARAEQIYHRLQLCATPKEIEALWMSGVEPFLQGAVEDLPIESKPVLASFLGIRLKQEDLDAAGIAEWERYTAREADELVKLGHHAKALALLQKRKERTEGSPLHLIEARILAFKKQWNEANRVIQLALKAASLSGSRKDMLDAVLLAAQIAKDRGRITEADEYLREGTSIAAALHEPAREMLAVLQRMRLRRLPKTRAVRSLRFRLEGLKLNPKHNQEYEELSARMAELLGQLSDSQWLENKSLVRASVSLLGADYSDFVMRMLRRVGLGELDEDSVLLLQLGLHNLYVHSAAARQLTDDFAKTLKIRGSRSLPMKGALSALEQRGKLMEFHEELLWALQQTHRLDEFVEKLVPIMLKEPKSSEQMWNALAALFSRETTEELKTA